MCLFVCFSFPFSGCSNDDFGSHSHLASVCKHVQFQLKGDFREGRFDDITSYSVIPVAPEILWAGKEEGCRSQRHTVLSMEISESILDCLRVLVLQDIRSFLLKKFICSFRDRDFFL